MRQCSLCFFSVQQQKRLTQLLLFLNSSQPDAPVNKIQRFFCGFGSAECTVLCYALKLCLVRQYAPVLCLHGFNLGNNRIRNGGFKRAVTAASNSATVCSIVFPVIAL